MGRSLRQLIEPMPLELSAHCQFHKDDLIYVISNPLVSIRGKCAIQKNF